MLKCYSSGNNLVSGPDQEACKYPDQPSSCVVASSFFHFSIRYTIALFLSLSLSRLGVRSLVCAPHVYLIVQFAAASNVICYSIVTVLPIHLFLSHIYALFFPLFL